MPSHYVYLIASLPTLQFGQVPPFSFNALLAQCEHLIPQQDWEILKSLPSGVSKDRGQPILAQWLNFETMLRNELVKARAVRHKVDPAKYLRPDGYAGPSLYHVAVAACKNPSPLHGERLLDSSRWNHLDELSLGHYFDFDTLIIYALKLLILERWEKINGADGHALLHEALQ